MDWWEQKYKKRRDDAIYIRKVYATTGCGGNVDVWGGKTHGWWARTFLVRSGKDREEIGEDEEHRNAQSIVAHSAFGVCEERLTTNR